MHHLTVRGKKRRYSSKNGIVSAISRDNGNVLDFTVLTKNCKTCKYWEKKRDTPEYGQFLLEHDCPINYRKSFGSMESFTNFTHFTGKQQC